jgi:hypothetical protein
MRGKRARVTNGELVPVTFPLYGYAYSDDRRSFVIDEESAAVVRRIFDLYSRGNSIAKIVALLDQDGIPTPTRYLALRGWLPGGRKTTSRWVWGTVQYILHNRAYIGGYTSHGVSMRGVCPAIIDREVFERVQEQFSRNQQEATRNNKRSPEDRGLLARGYVVCGYCGHPMTAVYGKDRRARYRCRSLNHQHADRLPGCAGCTVAIERIDADVWGKVAELLTHPEYVRQVIERWQAGEREAGPGTGTYQGA